MHPVKRLYSPPSLLRLLPLNRMNSSPNVILPFTRDLWARPRARRRTASNGYKKSEKISTRVSAMRLRYHRLKLWLILLYATITCFSRAVTCILCYRPIRLKTYIGQGLYTQKQYINNDWWTTVARVSKAIVSSLAILATSAICSKASVAYCETPPSADQKELTMRQILALADKGWSDFRILATALRPRLGRRTRSRFLVFSALLRGLGQTLNLI